MRPLLLTLLVLVAVSVCMTVVWGVCSAARPQVATFTVVTTPTGLAITPATPRPTPTEEWTLIGAGLSWLVTFAAGVTAGIMWVAKRKRTPREEKA